MTDDSGGIGSGAFGGGGTHYDGNAGEGGNTGGRGSDSSAIGGGGGGSFSADSNGMQQLDWYGEGNCSIEYIDY